MKIKFIPFIASAICIGMVSCNKAEIPTDSSSSVESYMTLELSGPLASITKTDAGNDGTVNGTAVENKISSIKVLLCTPETHKVEYSYTISDGLVETATGARTLPIKVETGKYEVYVIANPGTVAPSVSDDISATTVAITEETMKTSFAADNKFIMFNENNTSAVAKTIIEITSDNDYDHPATCDAINLDRLSVKITPSTPSAGIDVSKIKDATTGEFPSITKIELVGFRLLNGATKTNLMQHWTAAANTAGTYGWKNTLVSPVLTLDNYYNKLADFRTIVKTSNADGTETYTTVKDTYNNIDPYTDETAPIYCMENNSTWNGTAVVEALKGNTTGLVFKFQATVDGTTDNTFFGYNGKFYATLAALQADNASAFLKAAPTGTEADQLAAAEAELATATTEDAISAFRTKYLVKVYNKGVVYYTYYIKDKNYEEKDVDNVDGNYYSVMRNTIYGLNVTALQRIGTDIPGGWNPTADPDDPVDTKDVYMLVEAKVNPWVLSNEDITLK